VPASQRASASARELNGPLKFRLRSPTPTRTSERKKEHEAGVKKACLVWRLLHFCRILFARCTSCGARAGEGGTRLYELRARSFGVYVFSGGRGNVLASLLFRMFDGSSKARGEREPTTGCPLGFILSVSSASYDRPDLIPGLPGRRAFISAPRAKNTLHPRPNGPPDRDERLPSRRPRR